VVEGGKVKRILVTGMSGTGKSTVIEKLAGYGYRAIDADCDAWSTWVDASEVSDAAGSPVEADRDWVWREERIRELLAAEDGGVLFVGGCAANMGQFLPQFDHVVLLSAPAAVLVDRLGTRTAGAYGARPEEVARVLELLETVEPLLRRVADYEVSTVAPVDDVVATILKLAQA
jgi:shikimate kinase